MEQTTHLCAVNLVLRNADSRHQKMDSTTFDVLTLDDLGYDSLSVFELVIAVEQEMEERGITTDIDDDRWNRASLVTAVVADIQRLIEGRE